MTTDSGEGAKPIHDPGLYRRMSEPFKNADEAQAALEAFVADLRLIREKHRIRDGLTTMTLSFLHEGEERDVMMTTAFGRSTAKIELAAFAFGEAKAQHETMVAEVQTQGVKSGKRR